MQKYSVIVNRAIARSIQRLPRPLQDRVRQVIYDLETNPYSGEELRRNLRGIRKIPVGRNFRVLYRVDEQEKSVHVISAKSRGSVYRIKTRKKKKMK